MKIFMTLVLFMSVSAFATTTILDCGGLEDSSGTVILGVGYSVEIISNSNGINKVSLVTQVIVPNAKPTVVVMNRMWGGEFTAHYEGNTILDLELDESSLTKGYIYTSDNVLSADCK